MSNIGRLPLNRAASAEVTNGTNNKAVNLAPLQPDT
jgi:hypothetical protein